MKDNKITNIGNTRHTDGAKSEAIKRAKGRKFVGKESEAHEEKSRIPSIMRRGK